VTDTHGAIVIGGSIAGLLTARALVESTGSVLVLDRDDLPLQPQVRKCAGQGAQAHLLLDSGRAAVEALLPGVFEDIVEDGGLQLNFGAEVAWYHAGGFKVRAPTDIVSQLQSRPLLEHHIRRRVEATEGITVRRGARALDLRVSDGRVRGVVVAGPRGEELIEAPIVIDASGRGSQAEKWLRGYGFDAPPTDELDVDLKYAGRVYQRPAFAPPGTRAFVTYGDRKRTKRHGLLFEMEGDRWQVTLMGYHGDHPPSDVIEWEEWLASLEHPQLSRLLANAVPLTNVRVFSVKKQVRKRFERVRLPEGFAVLGDAACAFDPVFGQGMSVAAVTALGIRNLLARRTFDSAAVQRVAARAADRAWLVTSIEAMRYREGGRRVPGVGLVHAFLDRVGRASTVDPVVYNAFLQVLHLHKGVSHLLRPDRLWRIFRPRFRARQPRALPTASRAAT
jgi:2-polyprenyl-6-methoxyphenol hydroxylase-like FAD-dependent oxidoreductase